jgi:hypothetical protein
MKHLFEPDSPAFRLQLRSWRDWFQDRQATLILVAILLLIVLSPTLDYWPNANVVFTPTVALLILAAVRNTHAGRVTLSLTLVLAGAWAFTLPVFGLVGNSTAASNAVMLAMNAVMLVMMIRHVTGATEPDWETLSAALSGCTRRGEARLAVTRACARRRLQKRNPPCPTRVPGAHGPEGLHRLAGY